MCMYNWNRTRGTTTMIGEKPFYKVPPGPPQESGLETVDLIYRHITLSLVHIGSNLDPLSLHKYHVELN
ncbi:hypothetical protein ACN38_g2642 [Penicillium nordicum]|uniref:Uncharacterized protein n=1 Tax=Penicillium nordicum TaxID=229535 RepID=A0A0M8PDL0_9EURO|nr:hypothetical protein ACN38_g2642 [Penicillium nordicum]